MSASFLAYRNCSTGSQETFLMGILKPFDRISLAYMVIRAKKIPMFDGTDPSVYPPWKLAMHSLILSKGFRIPIRNVSWEPVEQFRYAKKEADMDDYRWPIELWISSRWPQSSFWSKEVLWWWCEEIVNKELFGDQFLSVKHEREGPSGGTSFCCSKRFP